MAKNKKNPQVISVLLLVVVPLVAIAASLFVLTRGVRSYLETSHYFKIRHLEVEGIADSRYVDLMKKELVGVNIFDRRVDMQKLAEKIRRRFPTFYSVTVRRVLPNELRVVAKERLPVAVIRKDATYVLDDDGVALMQLPLEASPHLPLIIGLDGKLPKIKAGDAVGASSLRRALLLARALRRQASSLAVSFPPGVTSRVTKIDASDPAHPFFYLGEDIQVKVSEKELAAQLELLPSILKSLGADLPQVRYIDLRPREPVVAMKDKKKGT